MYRSFIVHPVINIYIYISMYTLFAEYFMSEILLNPLLCNRVVAHPINYHRDSLIFAYRVWLVCTRSINNIPYIKICEYVRIYIYFLGSFAQPKRDGFLECMNWSLYHTLDKNVHQKVRANFLARQLHSCLDLRTRNKIDYDLFVSKSSYLGSKIWPLWKRPLI